VKKKSLHSCSKITLEVFSPGNSITIASTLTLRLNPHSRPCQIFQDVVTLSGTIHHFDCQTATIERIEIKSSEPSRNHNEEPTCRHVFFSHVIHVSRGDDAVKKELFGTSLYQHPVINDAPPHKFAQPPSHQYISCARVVTSVFSDVQTSIRIYRGDSLFVRKHTHTNKHLNNAPVSFREPHFRLSSFLICLYRFAHQMCSSFDFHCVLMAAWWRPIMYIYTPNYDNNPLMHAL
jgi:hypothetical protein